jgi:hypothetical protein
MRYRREKAMKKLMLLVIILMFSLTMGCDDLADVTVNVSEPGDSYDLTGSSARFSEDIDLTDESDYSDWEDYIKDLNITIKYRISENSGDDVTITFFATDFGGDFDSAEQITEPIEVPAGFETAAWTNVIWIDGDGKAYFEDLLQIDRQLTIWIDIVSTGTYDIVMETMYDIKIIANPFE